MFSDPEKNIQQLEIEPGMHVADFGAGSGFYTLRAAHSVGKNGRVYAVDIQKELLSRIQGAAREQGLMNVEIVWGDIDADKGSTLSSSSMDIVIISNVLFQTDDVSATIQEVGRVLKPGGQALFIEWSDSFDGLGPHVDAIIPEHTLRNSVEEQGMYIEKGIDAGAHHYGFIARKE